MEPQAVAPLQPVSTPQAAPQQFGQSNIPGVWPDGFGLFKFAKAAYMLNLGPNLALIAINIVLSGVSRQLPSAISLIIDIASIALTVASTRLYLAGGKGIKLSLGAAFPKDFMLYVKYVGLSLLLGLTFVISFVLLVIPAFIIMPRLSLATYFLIDQDMGVIDSYKASWNATKGNVGKVWGIIAVSLLFALLILVIVGIYFSIMYSGAFALLYLFLVQQHGGVQGGPAPQPVAPVNAGPAPVAPQIPVTPNLPPQNTAPQPPVVPPTGGTPPQVQ